MFSVSLIVISLSAGNGSGAESWHRHPQQVGEQRDMGLAADTPVSDMAGVTATGACARRSAVGGDRRRALAKHVW
jgi:hypothetical protein